MKRNIINFIAYVLCIVIFFPGSDAQIVRPPNGRGQGNGHQIGGKKKSTSKNKTVANKKQRSAPRGYRGRNAKTKDQEIEDSTRVAPNNEVNQLDSIQDYLLWPNDTVPKEAIDTTQEHDIIVLKMDSTSIKRIN